MAGYDPVPSATPAQPVSIKKLGNKELELTWTGDHKSVYPFRYLRQNCPCAMCVDEWSGKPLLARESVPQDLEGLNTGRAGNYALSVQFSDGHSTGLYTFQYLKKICPCAECASKAALAVSEKQFLDKNDLRRR